MKKFNNWSLCCISKTLSDNGTNFKTMTLTQFNKLPREVAMKELCSRILHNFKVTNLTIRFCQLNNINGYRLSSSLCPIISHDSVNLKVCDLPNFEEIKIQIDSIKEVLKRKPIRISAHPSEYISISTTDENVLKNSFRDLEQHAEIFDLLNLPEDYTSPLNIHVRKDGDSGAISDVVMRNYTRLPDNVRKRLVFENNDNRGGVWSVKELYKRFYEPYKIPVTMDYLHHSLLPDNLSEEEAFHLAHSTWPTTPLFHYSEGIVENNVTTRKHKDMPDNSPTVYNENVYFDVELKKKELAIFELQK